MAEDWSEFEVEVIIEDYFSMLLDELKSVPVNKASHNRALLPKLNNRSKASIEFKHRNISAVLAIMGLPYVKGYLPAYNFQKALLPRKVQNYLNSTLINSPFSNNFEDDELPAFSIPSVSFDKCLVEPPTLTKDLKEPEATFRKPSKIDYLKREQKNRSIGLLGEEFVIEFEKYRLSQAGEKALANQVEWTSKKYGDGLGFDILSKNLDGSDKFIEVKTTMLGMRTPFFFSSNELSFSKEKEQNFSLYRVFDFSTRPKLFSLNGCIENFCNIEAIQFKGFF